MRLGVGLWYCVLKGIFRGVVVAQETRSFVFTDVKIAKVLLRVGAGRRALLGSDRIGLARPNLTWFSLAWPGVNYVLV